MTKTELKTGMIVMIRNGNQYLVLKDTDMKSSDFGSPNILVGINNKGSIHKIGWLSLDAYEEDLTRKESLTNEWDIMEVLRTDRADDVGSPEQYKTIWYRENERIKRWT